MTKQDVAMGTLCPKCGYERTAADADVPEWKCPQCEVVYSKVKPKPAPGDPPEPAPQIINIQTPTPETTSPFGVGMGIAALVIGVFAIMGSWIPVIGILGLPLAAIGFLIALVGRVAARGTASAGLPNAGLVVCAIPFLWQMFVVSAVTDTYNEYQANAEAKVGSSKPPAAPVATPEPANPPPDFMYVRLLDKGYRAFDASAGGDAITLKFEFYNSSPRDVSAFSGVVLFSDLLGEPITRISMSYDRPVLANQTVIWHAETNYNQFIQTDRQFRNKERDQLRTRFTLSKVLYADGTLETFDN